MKMTTNKGEEVSIRDAIDDQISELDAFNNDYLSIIGKDTGGMQFEDGDDISSEYEAETADVDVNDFANIDAQDDDMINIFNSFNFDKNDEDGDDDYDEDFDDSDDDKDIDMDF